MALEHIQYAVAFERILRKVGRFQNAMELIDLPFFVFCSLPPIHLPAIRHWL